MYLIFFNNRALLALDCFYYKYQLLYVSCVSSTAKILKKYAVCFLKFIMYIQTLDCLFTTVAHMYLSIK